jgi:hypothetical protein
VTVSPSGSPLQTEFDLGTPYATAPDMVRVVRRLESGGVPDGYVLDPLERLALMENVRRLLVKTLPAAGVQSAQAVASKPRWRFVSQIPEARDALRQALLAKGVTPRF